MLTLRTRLLTCVLVSLTGSAAAFTYGTAVCEGSYAAHLQGIALDGQGAVYWSFTVRIVKTDAAGRVLRSVKTPGHSGDLAYHAGKLYCAVNLGEFNREAGKADSQVWVHDGDTLEVLARFHVPQVVHGAGGVAWRNHRLYVVGGLPPGHDENYVYEYTEDCKFLGRHAVASGYTKMGIQTACHADGSFWLGCYGNVLLKTDEDFRITGKYAFNGAYGLAGLGGGHLLVGQATGGVRHSGRAERFLRDGAKGLVPLGKPCRLWDPSREVPRAGEIPLLDGVQFHVVKKREPEVDGITWLHGAAIAWHRKTLFASWGCNKGAENTATEENRGRRSRDGGATWSATERIAPSLEDAAGRIARSHGVFLSRGPDLWLFLGRFRGFRNHLSTEALVLDEPSDTWRSRGIAIHDPFWPMCEPVPMDDGNWIMAGVFVLPDHPHEGYPGVAISRGKDLLTWRAARIPTPFDLRLWGETTAVVGRDEILAIVRYGARPIALVSTSRDRGRTWSPIRESNLPMTASKPYAGILSTGQMYLIGNTTRDNANRRFPLTIAVGNPGEKVLSRMWKIREGRRAGEAAGPDQNIAYPYAVEREGKLYVIYSVGYGSNQNSAELAVIPLSALRCGRRSAPLSSATRSEISK